MAFGLGKPSPGQNRLKMPFAKLDILSVSLLMVHKSFFFYFLFFVQTFAT